MKDWLIATCYPTFQHAVTQTVSILVMDLG